MYRGVAKQSSAIRVGMCFVQSTTSFAQNP